MFAEPCHKTLDLGIVSSTDHRKVSLAALPRRRKPLIQLHQIALSATADGLVTLAGCRTSLDLPASCSNIATRDPSSRSQTHCTQVQHGIFMMYVVRMA